MPRGPSLLRNGKGHLYNKKQSQKGVEVPLTKTLIWRRLREDVQEDSAENAQRPIVAKSNHPVEWKRVFPTPGFKWKNVFQGVPA